MKLIVIGLCTGHTDILDDIFWINYDVRLEPTPKTHRTFLYQLIYYEVFIYVYLLVSVYFTC